MSYKYSSIFLYLRSKLEYNENWVTPEIVLIKYFPSDINKLSINTSSPLFYLKLVLLKWIGLLSLDLILGYDTIFLLPNNSSISSIKDCSSEHISILS